MGFPKMGYINSWIGWFMMEHPKTNVDDWTVSLSAFWEWHDQSQVGPRVCTNILRYDIHSHTFSCPFPDILRQKLIVLGSENEGLWRPTFRHPILGESHHPWGPNPRWRFQNCKTFQQLRCLQVGPTGAPQLCSLVFSMGQQLVKSTCKVSQSWCLHISIKSFRSSNHFTCAISHLPNDPCVEDM